jgi:hypothetical protein
VKEGNSWYQLDLHRPVKVFLTENATLDYVTDEQWFVKEDRSADG